MREDFVIGSERDRRGVKNMPAKQNGEDGAQENFVRPVETLRTR
jgi:hypothetical protein